MVVLKMSSSHLKVGPETVLAFTTTFYKLAFADPHLDQVLPSPS
jgi:hypothetical protein